MVDEDDVAESVVCGPDPERYVAADPGVRRRRLRPRLRPPGRPRPGGLPAVRRAGAIAPSEGHPRLERDPGSGGCVIGLRLFLGQAPVNRAKAWRTPWSKNRGSSGRWPPPGAGPRRAWGIRPRGAWPPEAPGRRSGPTPARRSSSRSDRPEADQMLTGGRGTSCSLPGRGPGDLRQLCRIGGGSLPLASAVAAALLRLDGPR